MTYLAVTVPQLVEQLLPVPEMCVSNATRYSIEQFPTNFNLEKTKRKEKEFRNSSSILIKDYKRAPFSYGTLQLKCEIISNFLYSVLKANSFQLNFSRLFDLGESHHRHHSYAMLFSENDFFQESITR